MTLQDIMNKMEVANRNATNANALLQILFNAMVETPNLDPLFVRSKIEEAIELLSKVVEK